MKVTLFSTRPPIVTLDERMVSQMVAGDSNEDARGAQLRLGIPDIASFRQTNNVEKGEVIFRWEWYRIRINSHSALSTELISDVHPRVENMSHRFAFPLDVNWNTDIVPHLREHNVPREASCQIQEHGNMTGVPVHVWTWTETTFGAEDVGTKEPEKGTKTLQFIDGKIVKGVV